MIIMHPATLKKMLRGMLGVTEVVTTASLKRRQLLQVADWLKLPRETRTCRTRVNQPDAIADLEFVALNNTVLTKPTRDLLHQAALTEYILQHDDGEPGRWQLVNGVGRGRSLIPDAEILSPQGSQHDIAVEVDLGYPPKLIREKLEAFCDKGYTRIIWATSVHARTTTIPAIVRELGQEHRLPDVRTLEITFIDFWSEDNPYKNRTRCNKPVSVHLDGSGTITNRTRS